MYTWEGGARRYSSCVRGGVHVRVGTCARVSVEAGRMGTAEWERPNGNGRMGTAEWERPNGNGERREMVAEGEEWQRARLGVGGDKGARFQLTHRELFFVEDGVEIVFDRTACGIFVRLGLHLPPDMTKRGGGW